ncbi:MAG: winged helix-turn-helix domain-containing protein [Ruminiclostridium sp.]|nr:winged helix-turn-helix domain-containing protein [Ruminiclostridium sp.]
MSLNKTENIHISGVPGGFVRRERPGISAPLGAVVCCAGYGKSAYLAGLAEDTPGSVLICLAAYDNCPERIAGLLGAGEGESGYDAVCRFIDKMSAYNGLVLVDNADAVTEKTASAFMDLLCRAAVSGRLRLIVTGREIPGFMLKYLMNGSAALYGADDMRFTRAETAVYLKLIGRDYSDVYLNTLYSFTDGWCAGVSELAKAARSDEDIEKCVSRTLIGRYIASELLSELDSDLADYLKLISFIGVPDEEFSASVLRISDSAAKEDRLVGLGVISRGNDGMLRLPGVMRTVLAGMMPSERKRGIIERAAAYYIKEKRFAEAIKLFDVSGNSAAAERIIKSNGERFLENYEFELIGYCGDIIEKNGGSKDPEVLGILAQYYYYCGELAKMESALNMADSMFGRENRYSVYRRLYNGLIRYEGNKELYTANVRSACEYLEAHSLPMPFLYQKELDTLAVINSEDDDSGKLHIHRFGTLRLTVGDTEIQCKSRRSIELIAYMLERGGRPVPREELLNMLWSSDIPANAVAMLHNVIYGLRRELSAFGLENVMIYKNKCYLLDMSMIAEDDREILEVCEAVENSDKKKLAAHENVLESYWGRYLGTSDSRGSDERREYYDRCFVNACVMAAEMCRERGDRERELLFLTNASEKDPYSEQIVCGIMMCCFALGKPDKAKKKYEDYTKLIDEELGITPSKWLKNEFLSGFANDSEG